MSEEGVFQQAPNPPKFAQPGFSGSEGLSSAARGYKFVCESVPIWLVISLVRGVQSWVCLTCVIMTYSHGAVQIRVCLELAERFLEKGPFPANGEIVL